MEVKNNNEQFIDDCRKIQAQLFLLSGKLSLTVDQARRAGIRQGVTGQELIANRIGATMRPIAKDLAKGGYFEYSEEKRSVLDAAIDILDDAGYDVVLKKENPYTGSAEGIPEADAVQKAILLLTDAGYTVLDNIEAEVPEAPKFDNMDDTEKAIYEASQSQLKTRAKPGPKPKNA